MRTRLLVPATLLATVALVPAVWAQEAASSDTPSPAAATESKVAVTKGKDTLSVDFPDEEIRNVLRNVADLFELNLVIPDTLQGKTSIKLRDVTWRQIFQVVLNPVGYTYIEDGNIIKVVTAESLNMEPLSTEVFILNYAKAADVKPSLDAMVDTKTGGKIVVDARSNALIVSERSSAIQRIRPIIQNLDRATDQVMIETKFIEVSDGDTKDLGLNWKSLQNLEVKASKNERTYTQTNGRTNTNSHTEENIDVPFMQNGYEKLDTLANRNLPQSVVNDINQPGRGYGPQYDPTTYAIEDGGPASKLENLFTNNISRVTSSVLSTGEFSVVLSALNTLENTKLVSNPTVVTLNNTEATINVGEEYPVPNYQYNQERGSFEVSGFTYKPIGVILKVTPQVNAAGFIKLSVEPEVSDRTSTVNFGSSGSTAEIPIIGVRKTKTQVTLKDGYTLGLGGLVSSTANKQQSKIPLLGNIPGLGRLFRHDSKSSHETNLLIFITAKTVKPDGATAGEIFDPRMIRKMGLEKDELPGFRDGSDPFAKPAPVETAKDKKADKKKK
jgi:type IV pilus secretin PilQ/predicted competence protein